MRKKDIHFVYFLLLAEEVVYVGLTSNVERRLKLHKDKVYTSVTFFEVDGKFNGLYWERRWALFFMPKYNWLPLWCLKKEQEMRKIYRNS